MIREEINKFLKEETGEEIENSHGRFGDYCLTPAALNRILKKENVAHADTEKKIADDLKTNFPGFIEKVEFESGFLNIYLSKSAYERELKEMSGKVNDYLKDASNSNQTIVFDYSGPNIAKPFSVGHLRSTIIGQANYNIHKALGYTVVGINHIGDWGTQFGKLIYAICEWGDEDKIAKNPIEELNCLYIKFHEEAEKNPQLEDLARAWSKKLEDGDKQARDLWKKCVDWSFKEFDRIYKILNIKIDNVVGESFYEDKLAFVVKELESKNLLEKSEGALIVKLDNLPPALIKRQDGGALYMTRDLAALKYRIDKYKSREIVYHVGQDQDLHFKQLESIAQKLGWLENTHIVFAGHGMMRLPEGKMSTRKGRVILLDDLIREAEMRVLAYEKDREVSNIEGKELELATSAIKYADLSTNRLSDVVFSFDRLIDLKGNSAIYLQYSYARMRSLLSEFTKRFGGEKITEELPIEATEIAKAAIFYKDTLLRSANANQPNILCDFAFDFANKFNSFYEKQRIITDDASQSSKNIWIVKISKDLLGSMLDLLGLSKLDKI